MTRNIYYINKLLRERERINEIKLKSSSAPSEAFKMKEIETAYLRGPKPTFVYTTPVNKYLLGKPKIGIIGQIDVLNLDKIKQIEVLRSYGLFPPGDVILGDNNQLQSWLRDTLLTMNSYYPEIKSLEQFAILPAETRNEIITSLSEIPGFDNADILREQGNEQRFATFFKESLDQYQRSTLSGDSEREFIKQQLIRSNLRASDISRMRKDELISLVDSVGIPINKSSYVDEIKRQIKSYL